MSLEAYSLLSLLEMARVLKGVRQVHLSTPPEGDEYWTCSVLFTDAKGTTWSDDFRNIYARGAVMDAIAKIGGG